MAMPAQWHMCLIARGRMNTVVAINTVDRAVMGTEQGIVVLTRKLNRQLDFSCSRQLAGRWFQFNSRLFRRLQYG